MNERNGTVLVTPPAAAAAQRPHGRASERNGAMDVLRALAIGLVVNCHIYNTFAPGGPLRWLFGPGGHGVDLFFVLSGWLLGHQLLVEREKTGTIDVRRFWLRRAMRILPAYYAVLGLIFLHAWWRGGPSAVNPWYLVFVQNYFPTAPYFGVSWSLCVEEHFYLLVAPVLLLMGRVRGIGPLVCLLLAVPAVCRAMGWYASPGMFETHVRYDQCAAGVALAWVCVCRPVWWAHLARLAGVLAIAGVIIFIGRIVWGPVIRPHAGVDVTLIWTPVFASWLLLANSSRWWAGGLNFALTRYLANRAYALYLLHMEAMAVVSKFGELPLWVRFGLVWAISLALAEILYRVVERPGMRAREWFAITRSGKGPAKEPAPVHPGDSRCRPVGIGPAIR